MDRKSHSIEKQSQPAPTPKSSYPYKTITGIEGILDGEYEEWWPSGKLYTRYNYEKGILDGKYASDSTWTASETVNDYQGIDTNKMIPYLVKGLKEAIARIETLETKVTALEG